MRAPPSGPQHLPKAAPPNTITLDNRIPTCEFGVGGTFRPQRWPPPPRTLSPAISPSLLHHPFSLYCIPPIRIQQLPPPSSPSQLHFPHSDHPTSLLLTSLNFSIELSVFSTPISSPLTPSWVPHSKTFAHNFHQTGPATSDLTLQIQWLGLVTVLPCLPAFDTADPSLHLETLRLLASGTSCSPGFLELTVALSQSPLLVPLYHPKPLMLENPRDILCLLSASNHPLGELSPSSHFKCVYKCCRLPKLPPQPTRFSPEFQGHTFTCFFDAFLYMSNRYLAGRMS